MSCLVEPEAAARLLEPRRGLVREVVVASSSDRGGPISMSFSQVAGPLASYHRTVEFARRFGPDGLVPVRQEVHLRVGLPWWSWLFAPLLRAHLGRFAPGRAKMPWWGPPQRLDRRPAVMLATLAALVAVQGFVAGILPATLTYAASQMRAGTFAQGAVFAAVELSALPALAALVLADRRGRRSVLLSATGAAVVMSEVGAVVPSVGWLAITQVAAGALVAAGGIAAIVLAVEEVPDGCRAWSVGVLGMAGGLGAGVPLALLPLVDLGPGGWRWLYALSVCCLPVVIRSARCLPEGRRWSVGRDLEALLLAGHATSDGGSPLEPRREGPGSNVAAREGVRLPDTYALTAGRGEGRAIGGAGSRGAPGGHKLALLCAGAVLFAIFAVPAGQFQTQFLRDYRHYSALSISLLEQLSGTLGGLGVLVGGRMADTRGRRPVGVACVGGATLFTLAAYLTHAWLMWASATASQFFLYAAAPVLGVYGAELFTTRARARSAGLVSAASSVGAVAGLVSMGWLASRMGSFVPALALLAAGPAVLVVLLLLAYPESAGRSLDDLSTDLADRASLAGSAIVAAERQH